jgi:hypothetical protein
MTDYSVLYPTEDIIFMRTIRERPENRALTRPLFCKEYSGGMGIIPTEFEWDGSSSGIFAPIFPKWRHPIASCRHDYRCRKAKSHAERKWADKEFEKDVGETSWWITKKVGYIGVRAGAMLGIGNNF